MLVGGGGQLGGRGVVWRDGGRRGGGHLQGRQRAVGRAQALGGVAEEGQGVRDGVQGRSRQVLVQRVRQADGLRGRQGDGRAARCRGGGGGGGQGGTRGQGEGRLLDPEALLERRGHRRTWFRTGLTQVESVSTGEEHTGKLRMWSY